MSTILQDSSSSSSSQPVPQTVIISQQDQKGATTRPSLFEAKFMPKSGLDLHTQLPNASIHKGLLSEENVSAALIYAEKMKMQQKKKNSEEEEEKNIENNNKETSSTSSSLNKITKEYINKEMYGERAIVLHNVLSPEECLEVSSLTDQIEMHDANQDHRYRNNMRCEINSIPLAQVLYQRTHPFVEKKKIVTQENIDDYTQRELMIGNWEICGLNDHFRLCYYLGENKGHFGAHYDGEHNPSTDVCSIKTVMVYLNEDYEGGFTNFLREHMLYFDEARNIYCSPPEHVVAGLKAKQGDCLIFDHKILHEGSQVLSGRKFIFRTEMMYQRTKGDGSYEMSEEQKKGREFLAQARYHEDQRDFDSAVIYYKRAFKICPELEKSV